MSSAEIRRSHDRDASSLAGWLSSRQGCDIIRTRKNMASTPRELTAKTALLTFESPLRFPLGRVWLSQNASYCVARNQQFLVGGNYPSVQLRSLCADAAFPPNHLLILTHIYRQAGPLEARADARAYLRRMLANTGSKYHRVSPAHAR